MLQSETTESIGEWADTTFGITTALPAAVRLNEEVAELLGSLVRKATDQEITNEVADCEILIRRLAHTVGINLEEAVSRKMEINRGRKWKLHGDGNGQHEG